jgi:endonuclease G, mitochondrial
MSVCGARVGHHSPAESSVAGRLSLPYNREIRYTHFGVLFSTSHRQPVMTALNIDGAHGVRIKRKDDRWFADLRIPASIQLNQDDYNDPAIDRGHMVRREDPNWDTDAQPGADDPSPLAKRANDDMFHYTNAAVQHATLNQGMQLWLGLESYILDNARSKGFKACVFTAPSSATRTSR